MYSYEIIKKEIESIFTEAGIAPNFLLTQPDDSVHGEYSASMAFVLAKHENISLKECAEKYKNILEERLSHIVENIKVAGAGYINFYIKDAQILDEVENFAKNFSPTLFHKNTGNVMVEYTDPNCFKVFHIGHMMANTVGEALSRLYEGSGYKVIRICYPSDIGRNVALGVWGMMQKKESIPGDTVSLKEKAEFLGECYAYAYKRFEEDKEVQEEVALVNKAIYERSDEEIVTLYDTGRAWSLSYFEELYELLGTRFDGFIYESEVSTPGLRIVREFLHKGLFEESEGAVVYKGEQDGLHTRVFINQKGLPTYEAKDLGNYERKLELFPDAVLYVVETANEQNEYFKVINTVAQKIHPELTNKLVHVSHGLLRLPEGKMSSRTGNILAAEDLIDTVREKVEEKMVSFEGEENAKRTLVNEIAIGAIKFSIVRQSPGKDVIFDIEKSISFEGDSGPYLQYTHARISSLLEKARTLGIKADKEAGGGKGKEIGLELSRLLIAYPQTVEMAYANLGPQYIVTYLLSLARAFNSLYGSTIFLNIDRKESAYYVLLAEATKNILAHGLWLLGIKAPERM